MIEHDSFSCRAMPIYLVAITIRNLFPQMLERLYYKHHQDNYLQNLKHAS